MTQILRVDRVVADLAGAEVFYRDALGFVAVSRTPLDTTTAAALGLHDAEGETVVMRLGAQQIGLVRFAVSGAPYPLNSRSNDLWFQHLALVVDDIDVAYARLRTMPGWRPITEDGPQTLPPSNGSVRAFKFRDPDGHPLELIWFPSRRSAGIDHSALSVTSIAQSVAFYEALGFDVRHRSMNVGPAQSHLDGLADALVEVISLRPGAGGGMGLELLAYRPPGRPAAQSCPRDLVTDWVVLTGVPGRASGAVRDPDGHLLVLVDQGAPPIGLPA